MKEVIQLPRVRQSSMFAGNAEIYLFPQKEEVAMPEKPLAQVIQRTPRGSDPRACADHKIWFSQAPTVRKVRELVEHLPGDLAFPMSYHWEKCGGVTHHYLCFRGDLVILTAMTRALVLAGYDVSPQCVLVLPKDQHIMHPDDHRVPMGRMARHR